MQQKQFDSHFVGGYKIQFFPGAATRYNAIPKPVLDYNCGISGIIPVVTDSRRCRSHPRRHLFQNPNCSMIYGYCFVAALSWKHCGGKNSYTVDVGDLCQEEIIASTVPISPCLDTEYRSRRPDHLVLFFARANQGKRIVFLVLCMVS